MLSHCVVIYKTHDASDKIIVTMVDSVPVTAGADYNLPAVLIPRGLTTK